MEHHTVSAPTFARRNQIHTQCWFIYPITERNTNEQDCFIVTSSPVVSLSYLVLIMCIIKQLAAGNGGTVLA